MCDVRITVTKNKLYWCHGYLLVQNADCRPDTKRRLQTAEWVQNADWESKEFFVWFVITGHLTTWRASRNRFSAISFHDYLHYCGIFLAHFLMKIDRNINFKPSCSFLTLRTSWSVWCLNGFYQRNKSRCRCKWDVTLEYLTRATFEKQLTTLHVVRILIFLSGMCLFCGQKCGPIPKLFLRLDIFSKFVDHILFNLPYKNKFNLLYKRKRGLFFLVYIATSKHLEGGLEKALLGFQSITLLKGSLSGNVPLGVWNPGLV